MKKIIITVLALLLIPALTPVNAANDFVAESGFQFEVNGMTFGATGTIDELKVYSTYFTVEVSEGSEFTITNTSGYTYSHSAYSQVNLSCPGGESKLVIHGDGDHTFTFTPQSDTCSPDGGGGGGGSSGGTTSTPTTPTTPTTPETPADETPADETPTTPTVVTEDTISSTPGVPATTAEGRVTLGQLTADASAVASGDVNTLVAEMGVQRDTAKEAEYDSQIVSKVVSDAANATAQVRNTITSFVTYGTKATKSLGAGERAGVVNSYKEAFGKLPESQDEWNDVVKIANGRWPTARSETKENRAKTSFQTIYQRQPNMDDAHDNAAVTVMAYGLRPADRNLQSESAAINIFRDIFGYSPETASAWDAVRAIAYSGATR